MAITNEPRKTPEINTQGILPLRYYKHYKGGTYFVTGFAVHEKTGKTVIIYTDGYMGIPFVRFAEEFNEEVENINKEIVKRFKLIEKK